MVRCWQVPAHAALVIRNRTITRLLSRSTGVSSWEAERELMPVSVGLGLPTGRQQTLPPGARGAGSPGDTESGAAASRGEGSHGQSRQTQVAGPTWLPWKGLFKNNYY